MVGTSSGLVCLALTIVRTGGDTGKNFELSASVVRTVIRSVSGMTGHDKPSLPDCSLGIYSYSI